MIPSSFLLCTIAAGAWWVVGSSLGHFFQRGEPQSSEFPINERASKVWRWPLGGILPDKLLFKKFKMPRRPDREELSGILSIRWIWDKSNAYTKVNWPIFWGIGTVKLFLERFKECKPTRIVIPSGIFPNNLLLERSMFFPSPTVLYTLSLFLSIPIVLHLYNPVEYKQYLYLQ